MGHKLSKGNANIDILPQGRFNIGEEAPPSYIAEDKNVPRRVLHTEKATEMIQISTVEAGIADTSAELRGSHQDARRPSLYSTIDVVPQLDFYANTTFTGRQRRNRPSLEVLRKAFDVCAFQLLLAVLQSYIITVFVGFKE